MRACVLWCFVLACAGVAGGAAGPQKNIFDDDWEPPASEPAKRPAPQVPPQPPVKPPPPPVTPPRPPVTPPIAPPVAQPVTSDPAVQRLAVPAKEQQASVRKLLKEVFAEQLADRTPAGRGRLAETLLREAAKAPDAPTDRFVMLAAAMNAAGEAGALSLAISAAEQMSGAFDVDPLAVKVDAVVRTRPGPVAAAAGAAEQNVRAALALADELEAAEDFSTAARVCAIAQPMANTPALRTLVQQRQRDLNAARLAADRVAKDRETLKSSPDDAAANLGVGRYLCFTKADWKAGIPLLAKGSDATLKSLAAAELTPARDAELTSRTADGWWEYSTKLPEGAGRTAVMAHAADLYGEMIDGVSGLRKTLVEKRIAEARKLAGPQTVAPGAGVALRPGQVAKVRVEANQDWVSIGKMAAGTTLDVEIEGTWTDGTVEMVGPEGKDQKAALWIATTQGRYDRLGQRKMSFVVKGDCEVRLGMWNGGPWRPESLPNRAASRGALTVTIIVRPPGAG